MIYLYYFLNHIFNKFNASYVANTVLSTSQILTHLILTPTHWGRYFYFTDKESDFSRVHIKFSSQLPKSMLLTTVPPCSSLQVFNLWTFTDTNKAAHQNKVHWLYLPQTNGLLSVKCSYLVSATALIVRFLAMVSTLAAHWNHPEVSFNWSGVGTGYLF